MRRRTLLKAGAGALPLAALASTDASADRTTQTAFEPLDSLELDEAAETYVHGDAAYVASGDGLTVVDVSDPANISVLAEQRGLEIGGQPLSTAWDLWGWEDRVALVGPVQPTRGGSGFVLFDVSDPSQPEIAATHETGYYVHNSSIDDGMLYLTGNGLVREERRIPLVTFDLSGDEPEEVGRWSPVDHDEAWGEVPIGQRVLHDVHVHDGIAYLSYWDSGAWVVDISDPASPEVLSRVGDYTPGELSNLSREEAQQEYLTPGGNAHVTMVNDDASLMAVGVEAWAGEYDGEMAGGPGAVDLYDISDKTDPQQLSTIEPPESFDQTRQGWYTTAHNPHFAGDRLYTSWYYGGVKVHDISDPENPEELAWWRKPREANMWAAHTGEQGEFFVGTSWSGGSDRGALSNHSPGLYTFPDTAGEQPDPPDLTNRPTDLLGSTDESDGQEETDQEATDQATPTEEESDSANDGGGETETSTGTPEPADDESTATPTESDDGSGPGFGVGTTLAALGGGYLLRRHVSDDEE